MKNKSRCKSIKSQTRFCSCHLQNSKKKTEKRVCNAYTVHLFKTKNASNLTRFHVYFWGQIKKLNWTNLQPLSWSGPLTCPVLCVCVCVWLQILRKYSPDIRSRMRKISSREVLNRASPPSVFLPDNKVRWPVELCCGNPPTSAHICTFSRLTILKPHCEKPNYFLLWKLLEP